MRIFRFTFTILLLVRALFTCSSQNLPSAVVDFDANDKGILIPRVELTGPLDTMTISNPDTSLLVYNKADLSNLKPGYHYWNGTNWIRLSTSGVKGSFVIPDDYSFSAINQAIADLPAGGGTIYIRPGQYTVTNDNYIHINKSNVSLIGEAGTKIKLGNEELHPVILVGTTKASPDESEGSADRIHNVEIRNLEIDGNRTQQSSEDDENFSYIKNNCIAVRCVSNILLSNIKAHNAKSGGIVLSWSSSRVNITGCYLYDNFFDGLSINGCYDIMVANTMVYENDFSGVTMDVDNRDIVFTNMVIRNNDKNGIFARWSRNLIFNGLDIYENGENGVFASHDDLNANASEVDNLHFMGCLIRDNGTSSSHWGISLPSPSIYAGRNYVSNCVFFGNYAGSVFTGANDSLFQIGNILPDSSSINFGGGNIATNGVHISNDGDSEGILVYDDGSIDFKMQNVSSNGYDFSLGNSNSKLSLFNGSNYTPTLRLANTSYPTNRVGGKLEFGGHGNERTWASIIGDAENTTFNGRLLFKTSPDGIAQPVSRMVIDEIGNIGVGNLNPEVKLDVQGGVKMGDPDTNDDGLLDSDNSTSVPAGTVRFDASADKLQVRTSTAWVNLH